MGPLGRSTWFVRRKYCHARYSTPGLSAPQDWRGRKFRYSCVHQSVLELHSLQRCCTRLCVTQDTVNAFLFRIRPCSRKTISDRKRRTSAGHTELVALSVIWLHKNAHCTQTWEKLEAGGMALPPRRRRWHTGQNNRVTGGSTSGDRHGHSVKRAHGRQSGSGRAVMAGWAYLLAGIMTVDSLLLGLLLLHVRWPKRWKKNG